MHIGLIPDSAEEKATLDRNEVPFPVFEMINLTSIRLVMAAEKLKIFETLLECPQSAQQLAQKLSCSEFYIDILLKTLLSLGYLEFHNDCFVLSLKARTWLNPQNTHYIGHYLNFNYLRWRVLEHMEEVIKSDQAINLHQTLKDPLEWQAYLNGLGDLARITSEEIVKLCPVPEKGSPQLLDIGAGHGLYSLKMCERHPHLAATLLDLPGALQVAKDHAIKQGVTSRFSFIEANILEHDLPNDHYDYVFLFNLLHHFSKNQIQSVFTKISATLRHNGKLVIWDVFENLAAPSASLTQMASLMFALMSHAQAYPIIEVQNILNFCGFNTIETKSLLKIPGVEILIASKI
jgi:2-polyprenyl-3-methyl-5-hydroxy-6-metoxy-1,4-benzoquinol methylase